MKEKENQEKSLTWLRKEEKSQIRCGFTGQENLRKNEISFRKREEGK